MNYKKLLSRIRYLVFRSDLEGTRFTLSIGAIFIGLGFAWPAHLFPTVEQIAAGQGRSTYSLMAMMAPEWLWSVAFTAQGSIMLWSLLTNVRTKWLMWADAAFGVIIWTVAIAACYLAYWRGFDRIAEYRPPAIMGGEVAAMLAQWWILFRYHVGYPPLHDRRSTDRRAPRG